MSEHAFTVTLHSEPDYCHVTASGPAGLTELAGAAAMVAEVVERQAHSRVLADLSQVEPTLSFTEHLRLGSLASSVLAKLSQAAVVVPLDYIDAPSVKAARLGGLHVRAFLELAQARRWLDIPAISEQRAANADSRAWQKAP